MGRGAALLAGSLPPKTLGAADRLGAPARGPLLAALGAAHDKSGIVRLDDGLLAASAPGGVGSRALDAEVGRLDAQLDGRDRSVARGTCLLLELLELLQIDRLVALLTPEALLDGAHVAEAAGDDRCFG